MIPVQTEIRQELLIVVLKSSSQVTSVKKLLPGSRKTELLLIRQSRKQWELSVITRMEAMLHGCRHLDTSGHMETLPVPWKPTPKVSTVRS